MIHAVISNLRKISRAIELHSRMLLKEYGLTSPQLTILTTLERIGPLPVTDLSRRISLSQATATNILGRLEQQGFVTRSRRGDDKRMVYIELTDKTRAILASKPSPLNRQFLGRFQKLEPWEQTSLLSSLQRIAALMGAEEDEEAPLARIE